MKKILVCILVLIMSFVFISCKQEISSSKQPISDNVEVGIQNDETTNATINIEPANFVVGFDAEYPPYGFMDSNGGYTGFDLECAQEVCNRTGMNFVAQPIDWDSKDMELYSGNIDCIWNGFTMTGREKDYAFSVPYVDNSIVIAVLTDSSIKSLSDLAGKNVAVQQGSSALTALQEDQNVDLVNSFGSLEQVENYNTCFMNLESGFIDAIAVDLSVAKYQMSNNEKFRLLDEELQKEQYAIGFRIDDIELRDLVQNALFDMYKDGAYMKIANKYEEYGLPSMLCIDQYVK